MQLDLADPDFGRLAEFAARIQRLLATAKFHRAPNWVATLDLMLG